MNPIQQGPSYEEIVSNLEILKKTLGKLDQKIASRETEGLEVVDWGFIEIFNQDIDSLRFRGVDPSRVAKLQFELESIANRMTDIASKVLDLKRNEAPIEVPRMRDKISLQDLANEYRPSLTKTGLEKLDAQYELYRIRGEGHCLFRALAGSIFHLYATGTPAQRTQIDDRLNALQAELPHTGYIKKDDFTSFCRLLNSVHQKDKDPTKEFEAILKDKERSDRLVDFFRKLTVAQTAQAAGDNEYRKILEAQAEDENFSSLEEYFANMVSIKNRSYGGEVELRAFATAFNIKIHLHQPDRIGKYEQSKSLFSADRKLEKNLFNAMERVIAPESSPVGSVDLLYSPGHYDLLVRK